MLKPDGSCNPTKDKAWFGILTWVQPLRQTKPNKPRLVCSIFHLFRYIFSQVVKCEITHLAERSLEIDPIGQGSIFIARADDLLRSHAVFDPPDEGSDNVVLSVRR